MLIRGLINFAYRDYVAEARVVGHAAPFTSLDIEALHGEF